MIARRLYSVVCLLKGHDLLLDRQGGEVRDAGTIQEGHLRVCRRCGYVALEATVTWSAAIRTALGRRWRPVVLVERTPTGAVGITLTVVPLKKLVSRPIAPLGQRRRVKWRELKVGLLYPTLSKKSLRAIERKRQELRRARAGR